MVALPGSPIIAVVPGGASIGIYSANLTVNNGLESINYPITIEITPPQPTPREDGDPGRCKTTLEASETEPIFLVFFS